MEQYRKFTFLLIAGLVVITMGCSKFETVNETGIRDKFLVDKIYDNQNNLVAEYFYDKDNKLIKKVVTGSNPGASAEWGSYTDEFVYKNGRVSKVIRDQKYAIVSNIEYDSKGNLIKADGQETFRYRYEKGRIAGFLWDTSDASLFYTDTIVYDKSGNVAQYVIISPEVNGFWQPIPGTTKRDVSYFYYDNNPKPNFGLDYLFVYDPLPFSNQPELQRLLSKNNFVVGIGNRAGGSSWIYTYNENGLPSTIDVRWGSYASGFLLRISYKPIK